MLSRRAALKGGAASVAMAPAAVLAGPQEDAALLELVACFHRAYEAQNEALERWRTRKHRVTALPGYPGLGDWERQEAFMREHGTSFLSEEWSARARRSGKLAATVFDMPAATVQGAIEKLRIVRLAVGDGVPRSIGDPDLANYQDGVWMERVIEDLERLAGEG